MLKNNRKKVVKRRRKRECFFTKNKIEYIDYKDVALLTRFIANNGKILSTKVTGTKVHHQRKLSNAIKRARIMGLLSYTSK